MKPENNPTKSIKVALVWHTFGHDNLGVDALSRADAAIIEAAAAKKGLTVNFVTLGTGQKPNIPDLPSNVSIGPSLSLRQLLLGRSKFLAALRQCDMAVDIGEGDSFTDIYGRRRFAFQFGTKLSSILLRHPLVLAPQTIGPFEHPVHRWLAKILMNRITAVFARDHLSTSFLRELRTSSEIDEFVDVAFRLPFTPVAKTPGPVRIGINVSGLLFNRGYTGSNELGMKLDYAALTEALIKHFHSKGGVVVELFAHVSGGGGPDDDAPVIEELGRRYPGVKVVPRFASSVMAKGWMSGLDFVIAGRMHACIGAYSAGVPTVPIAYSRKFNGLFGTLNYPFFIDGKTVTTEAALSSIISWFDDRDALKKRLEESRALIEDRLARYENRIGDVLVAISKGRSS